MLKNKRGQVTLFIIIAIVIVGAALTIIFIPKGQVTAIPSKLQPVETSYLNCIQEKTQDAIILAETQGGYISLPEFEQGSQYKQFTNYYNFLGTAIPYWYYVSGNNIQKEQVPSKEIIQQQISNYVKEKISECEDFSDFESGGFNIEVSETNPSVKTIINNNEVEITVSKPITISFQDAKSTVSSHKTNVNSNLGLLYQDALKIYNYEQEKAFLENYTIDTLYLNAPVTGIELSCAPKTWLISQVSSDLKKALAVNIAQIKVKGTYYDLNSELNKYFVVNTGDTFSEQVNFIASEPYRLEIWPSENELLVASPIGIQQGLSLMGFCYVPYHFVYDVDYPVLVQVSKDNEIFQFPFAVVIDKTVPRKAELGETETPAIDICSFKGMGGTVYTYDDETNLPIKSEISFQCFDQICSEGTTETNNNKEYLNALFPQCLNGFIIAESEGYAQAKVKISTNEPFSSSIYLKKLKKLTAEVNIDSDESAIITFSSPEHSTTLFYPTQREIELISGVYNVTAQAFKERTIKLNSETGEQCIKTPDWMGILHEECFTMNIPEQTLTSVVFGGGSAIFSPTSEELSDSSKLKITIEKLNIPTTLSELEDVYSTIAISDVGLDLQ